MTRILRFDSVGGASGDMILGSLAALGADTDSIAETLSSMIPEPVRFRTETVRSHGVEGVRLTVEIGLTDAVHHEEVHHDTVHHDSEQHHHCHAHHHRSYADIRKMITEARLPETARQLSLSVFAALAEAEGAVHGVPADEVRFHEVGAVDSIADIVGSALAYEQLGLDGVSISPLPLGSGQVCCAHGVYPIPAPAVAELVRRFELPVVPGGPSVEALTPTGAAILAVWPKAPVTSASVLVDSGQSIGHAEMSDRPNLLRASIYEVLASSERLNTVDGALSIENLIKYECNLDDLTGEILASAAEDAFESGALDVWTVPIFMKKGRPGHLFGVLCEKKTSAAVLESIFRHTGTLGVREETVRRHALDRSFTTVETDFGPVRIKTGSRWGETLVAAPEYDDVRQRARERNVSAARVYRAALCAYAQLESERKK